MSTIPAFGNRTLEQLKVPELKEELRKRGIISKGLKKELVERLEQALREENEGGSQFVTGDMLQDAFRHGPEAQEDVPHDFQVQEDKPMDFSEPQGDAVWAGVKPQEHVATEACKPQEDSHVGLEPPKDNQDISQNHNDLPDVMKFQDDAPCLSKVQEDSPNILAPQGIALDVSELQEDSSDAVLEVSQEKNSSDVENVTFELHSGHEVSAVVTLPFLSNEVQTESPLVETLPAAEDVKTLDPFAAEGKSVEAVYLLEERKSAVETSMLVTTGFEIASSEDMETDVVVQSVPGFGDHSDLLPGTLCEAGNQSHLLPSVSKESMEAHQIGDSVEMFRQDHKRLDQSGGYLYPMHSESHFEAKSESVSPPERNVEEGSGLLTLSIPTEPEPNTEVSPVKMKATPQMSSDTFRIDTTHAKTNVGGVSESSLVESENLVEPVHKKFAKVSGFSETVESLIPEEIDLEDKDSEISISEQVFTDDKIVEKPSLILEAPGVKVDSQAEAVPKVPQSVRGEDSLGVMKIPKDMTPSVREDRITESRRKIEEKRSTADGLDAQKEEHGIKKFDREMPRDRQELSRSRVSQDGFAKVEEEVEKAGLKDSGSIELGFRSEPRVRRELVEEKIDSKSFKEDMERKGDLGRIENSKERDLKPMDIDVGGSKRKEPDEDSRQGEPLKRQRRWNSGKNLETESEVKPLSNSMLSERQRDIIPLKTETGNTLSSPASIKSPTSSRDLKPTYKGPATGSFDQHLGTKHSSYMPKADNASNEDCMTKRIVPAPTRSPTISLRIDGFIRPLTLLAVKNLLAQTGTYDKFWMDHIKSHCYVTYSTVEEATATRNALYNLQWPQTGGKVLVAEFVDPEEVNLKCESETDKLIATAVTARPTASLNDQISPLSTGGRSREHLPAPIFSPPPPPPKREKPIIPPNKVQEPAVITVDDLFKKTQAKPHIYYLPLTEEQVEAKLARSKASVNKVTTRT